MNVIGSGTKLVAHYLVEDDLVSEEELEKALELQSRRVQSRMTPLLGNILTQEGILDGADLNVELERQARERVRLYGKEYTGH